METPASIDRKKPATEANAKQRLSFPKCLYLPSRERIQQEGNKMKRMSILLLLAGATMAGCTPTQQGAGIGAASGAVIGGIATGNVRGAAVGAAIGGAAGAVIGNVAGQPGQCYYRDRYGRRYVASCPR